MQISRFIFFSFLMLLTSCDKTRVCSTCTYQRPDNNSTIEASECKFESDEMLLTEWEETFKTQVRALGGEWDSLEITCVREIL